VPRPTEKKYSAIICALNASGASLVVTDKPIGESRSSEIANNAMMPTTSRAGTDLPAVRELVSRGGRALTQSRPHEREKR